MLRTIFLYCGVMVLAWLLPGCSDDPNSVGKGLLPPSDRLKIVSIETTAVSGSNYLQRISGNFNRLLVGRTQSSEYEAVTLLQFSGLTPLRSSDSIKRAEIQFSITYRFPDSSGVFGMEARVFDKSFSQLTFTWDSLDTNAIGRTAVGAMRDSFITPTDSFLYVVLDTAFVRQLTDSGSGALCIRSSSMTQHVLGFDNYQDFLIYAGPKLIISVYDRSADSSITIEYSAAQRVFVANRNISAQAGDLTVQSGVSNRCILNFDVSKIETNASITQAIMIVRLDTVASLRSTFASNQLYANMVLDTSSPPRIGGVTSSSTIANDSLGAYFQFDVKNLVQQWVIGRPNYGVVLRPSEEFIALERYVVFGANASLSLRPTLIVKYSVLP